MLRSKVRGDLRLSPCFVWVDKASKVLVTKKGIYINQEPILELFRTNQELLWK